jgi:hypothetical protein
VLRSLKASRTRLQLEHRTTVLILSQTRLNGGSDSHLAVSLSLSNVEQVFSRAGNLSDPNMDPGYLAHLIMVGVNKKSYKPSTANVKDKYDELFRGQGGKVI